MTNNNSDSVPHFNFPSFPSSSSSLPNPIPFQPHKKHRKKRTKLIKIEPGLVPSSSTEITVSKPKHYSKKPDPSAPKITRPCTECGKKFWSWKALFGHMRCHPERQWRGINPPPNYRKPISPIQEDDAFMSAEDHEVASCLLFLSNSGNVDHGAATCTSYHGVEEDVNCNNASAFECSSCKKVFVSHQALGGHRATHKNVKGCFAITKSGNLGADQRGNCEIVEDDVSGSGGVVDDNDANYNNMVMALGHKCNICLRVFSSGQALGGHMRCHWDHKAEDTSSSLNNTSTDQGLNGNFTFEAKQNCGLDLNLPAPVEDESSSSFHSPLGFTLDLRLGL